MGKHLGEPGRCAVPMVGNESRQTSAIPLCSGPHLTNFTDGRFQPALIPAKPCCAHIVWWLNRIHFLQQLNGDLSVFHQAPCLH